MKLEWDDIKQKLRDKTNRILVRNSLLDYLHFNKIGINTDDSYFRLGSVISQEVLPFFSTVLNWTCLNK